MCYMKGYANMYEIIGCPMHSGVFIKGDGLQRGIDVLNENLKDLKIRKIDEIFYDDEVYPDNLKHIKSVIETCSLVAEELDKIFKRKNKPLLIGGDHALGMASVSAAANNCEKLGLIWIDAHTDINTDETSESGNIHGMPVAALMGYGEKSLTKFLNDNPKIKAENIVYFGLRDVDAGEKVFVKEHNIKCFYYDEIEKNGLQKSMAEAIAYLMEKADNIHISLDLDCMDPSIIKGVSVPVEKGFTPQEVEYILGELFNRLNISSVDIMEFNPKYDTDGYTKDVTVSLIEKISSESI